MQVKTSPKYTGDMLNGNFSVSQQELFEKIGFRHKLFKRMIPYYEYFNNEKCAPSPHPAIQIYDGFLWTSRNLKSHAKMMEKRNYFPILQEGP